jgi:soluble cytochrome b562
MAERAKDQKKSEMDKLEAIILKHENLIPTVMKTQVMVDLYWKCYAYGDELKPHIEFLDGIMLSSTRDIAPSCVENVDELIERQEKSLVQLETKRAVVKDLIEKGKVLLQNPDKPRFLDSHVSRIEVGWDDTKEKAQDRLTLLSNTKSAWEGYAEGNVRIAEEFDECEGETKKVKKRFNLEAAFEDLAKRQEIYSKTHEKIHGSFNQLKTDFETMCLTLPDDKKNQLKKELVPVEEKLVLVKTFEEKVMKINEFCTSLKSFDDALKEIDGWMLEATKELEDIKQASDKLTPEDRVSRTMDLQEDIAAKVEIIEMNVKCELDLLPQGDKVPQDAQDFKDELNRIKTYVLDLQVKTSKECNSYSEDVKYWAEYRTGIKEFVPWLQEAEKASTEGLSKPSNLAEAEALFSKSSGFDNNCTAHLKLLTAANEAAKKMTTHKEADDEVAALKVRYDKVKAVSDEWMKKVDTLVKEWKLLDNTVSDLNAWVAKDKSAEGENQFSLEKMESTLGELKNIFKQKEKLVENL